VIGNHKLCMNMRVPARDDGRWIVAFKWGVRRKGGFSRSGPVELQRKTDAAGCRTRWQSGSRLSKKKDKLGKSCGEKQKSSRRRASSSVLNDTIYCDWTDQVSPCSRRSMHVFVPFPFCRPIHDVERIALHSGIMFQLNYWRLGVLKHAASCDFLVSAIHLAPQA